MLFKTKSRPRYDSWNVWFAWHPVRVDGELVWLERVYRLRTQGGLFDDRVYYCHIIA